jgi:hypothetical protein
MRAIDNVAEWKCLLNANTRAMTEEETDIMLKMMMAEMQFKKTGSDPQGDQMEEQLYGFGPYAILKSRLANPTTLYLRVFISMLCKTPGDAVMWAYTLYLMWCDKGGDKDQPLDLEIFTEYFPWGVPEADEYKVIWDEQKDPDSPLSNLLDNQKLWPSPSDVEEAWSHVPIQK